MESKQTLLYDGVCFERYYNDIPSAKRQSFQICQCSIGRNDCNTLTCTTTGKAAVDAAAVMAYD